MATSKKALLIEYELEFLEEKLKELKQYIQDNPFSSLSDRMAWRETKSGGAIPICIANKEMQRKDLTQALKDYAEIFGIRADVVSDSAVASSAENDVVGSVRADVADDRVVA